MITQERKDFIIETLVNQRKWVDDNSDLILSKADWNWDIKNIPIRLIPMIDEDTVISFADWSYVIKENGGKEINKCSSDEELAFAFTSFLMGCEYLGYHDGQEIEIIKRSKWYCWKFQDSFFRANIANIESIFLEAFTCYVLGD